MQFFLITRTCFTTFLKVSGECAPQSLLCSEATLCLTGNLCTCSQKMAGMMQEGIKTHFIKVLPHSWASQEREAFVGIGSWQKTVALFMGFDATAAPPPTNSYVNSALHQEAEEWVIVAALGELPASVLFVWGRKYFSKKCNFVHGSSAWLWATCTWLICIIQGQWERWFVYESAIYLVWPEAGLVFTRKNSPWIWRGNYIL